MKTIPTISLLLLAGSLALVGCKTETGALLPKKSDQYTQETGAAFVLMDKGAQRSVTVAGLQQRTLPDGRLEAVANVRNRENRRLQVQVQCVFKDAQGFEVDSTPWQTLILTENGIETVRFTSLNDKAKHFTVRIREAR